MRRRVIGNMMGQPAGGGLTGLAYLQSLLTSANGAVYDFTDPTTMYNDTGGATPISSGTPDVARVDDLSGNGNHLVQYGDGGYEYDYVNGYMSGTNVYGALGMDGWSGGDGVTNFLVCDIFFYPVSPCDGDGKDRITSIGAHAVTGIRSGAVNYALSCDNTIRCDGTFIQLNTGYPTNAFAMATWRRVANSGGVRYEGVENTALVTNNNLAAQTDDVIAIGQTLFYINDAPPVHHRKALFVIEGTFSTTEIESIEAAVAEMAGHTY